MKLLPGSVQLPAAIDARDRSLNMAITDMYRMLQQRIEGNIIGSTTNGAFFEFRHGSELISFTADPTDSVADLLPASSLIIAVNTVVVTALVNVTTFSVGDPTSAARFSASAGGVTAGSQRIGIAHWSGAITTLALGPSQGAAAKVRLDRTAGAGAMTGAVRVHVISLNFQPPTS